MSQSDNKKIVYVHGNNINTKIKNCEKGSKRWKILNNEILKKYEIWRQENEELKGPFIYSNNEEIKDIIDKRTKYLNQYKDFIDKKVYADEFDSRSNLQSSVLEEFMYYLFKDVATCYNKETWVGKSHAFKDIFLRAKSFKDMVNEPNIEFETKDEDFIIGPNIESKFRVHGTKDDKVEIKNIQIPAVGIECKTYIDKNMLGEISMTAEQLKYKNPDALYIVAAERVKLTQDVNLEKYKFDQIYVLRKERNKDRKIRLLAKCKGNPIYSDVVQKLFMDVKNHLITNWQNSIDDGIKRGYLIKKEE